MQSTPHSPLPLVPTAGNGHEIHGQGYEGNPGEYGDYMNRGGSAQDHREAPGAPTSPNLTTAFHRGPAEIDTSAPFLRRRTTEQMRDMLRVAIATPFSENARRKERNIPAGFTVRQLKDEVAHDQEERYERSGMRLVWQGRIVRDEEVLGEIVGKRDGDQVHTFHLVARRIGGSTSPMPSRPTQIPSVPSPAVASTAGPVPLVSASPISRNAQALDDTVHFTLFMIRHHLCHLLGAAPLEWNDMIPPPVVDQETAREAIISVIAPFAAQREDRDEGWEGWRKAYEKEDTFDWHDQKRNEIQNEIKGLWSGRIGRAWQEGPVGEQAQVELDSFPYTLHLPPLSLMTPSQLVHLVLYLRLTTLLPMLNELQRSVGLSNMLIQPARTTAPPPTPPRIRQFGLRLRLTPATLTHLFFSAVKACAMIWMLTRSMKWDDFRFWIVGGGLMGWWIGDAANQLRPGVIWNNGRAAALGQAEAGAAAAGVNGDGAAGLGATGATFGNTARVRPSSGHIVTRLVPLLHLDTDAEQLHLAQHRPLSQPWRVVTQLLLPIALWFITLIPEWESLRARAIRRRERAMRVWVGELTVARNDAASEAARLAGELRGSGESAERRLQRVNEEEQEIEEQAPVLPDGLSVAAKRYYERVIGRGEGIDWEEEREAQRAMGIAEDEDRQDDDGMRMRML